MIDGSCQGNLLLLSSGQTSSIIADLCVDPFRKSRQDFFNTADLAGFFQLLPFWFFQQCDIFKDCSIKQKDILTCCGKKAPIAHCLFFPDSLAIYKDFPSRQGYIPFRRLISVVFPEPLSPVRAYFFPFTNVKSIPDKTDFPSL